jgi:UPF0716 family protein affecting phage T7 exclusion
MAEHTNIPAPTELVYLPKPSWGPAFFAGGLALLIGGFYLGEFMLPGWFWSLVGVVFILAAVRSMVAIAVRDFFRLPRRQRVRGAVLPAASMRSGKR